MTKEGEGPTPRWQKCMKISFMSTIIMDYGRQMGVVQKWSSCRDRKRQIRSEIENENRERRVGGGKGGWEEEEEEKDNDGGRTKKE